MAEINFDHSYSEDIGHRFYKSLGRAGFVLSEHQMEHPGKHFCRFIMFNRSGGRLSYLEFVNVGRGGKRVTKPGISLRCSGALKKYFYGIKKQKGIKAGYTHKNYDWKKDNKSRLPGWNFLTFKRPQFKNLFPWFTEYEARPGRKRVPPPSHPNTAQAICGIALSVRGADRPKLEKIFGKSLKNNEVRVGGISLFLEPGRSTKVTALIIKCKDLKRFMKFAKIRSVSLWQGKDAALIKNPTRGMWDVIAVEK